MVSVLDTEENYRKMMNIDAYEYYYNNHYSDTHSPNKKQKTTHTYYLTDSQFDSVFDMNNPDDLAMIQDAMKVVEVPKVEHDNKRVRILIGMK